MICLAYVAGLMDGEGTVTMQRPRTARKLRVPRVSVSNNRLELLDPLVERFGGNISTKSPRHPNHSTNYQWSLVYDAALSFLADVLPHMRHPEKCRRGNLLLCHYKALTKRNGKYTDEELEARRALETEFFKNSHMTS